jgi:hypothetical protein
MNLRVLGMFLMLASHVVLAEVIDVDPNDLTEYLKAHKNVVVQFTSPDKGCRPCVMAYKPFDQFALKNAEQATFVRIEWKPYHKFPKIVRTTYRLMGVPAQLCFRDGKKVAMHMGPMGERDARKIERFERDCFSDS